MTPDVPLSRGASRRRRRDRHPPPFPHSNHADRDRMPPGPDRRIGLRGVGCASTTMRRFRNTRTVADHADWAARKGVGGARLQSSSRHRARSAPQRRKGRKLQRVATRASGADRTGRPFERYDLFVLACTAAPHKVAAGRRAMLRIAVTGSSRLPRSRARMPLSALPGSSY